MSGPADIAGDQLRAIVERIEHIDEEIKELNEAKRASIRRPEHPASSTEFAQQMNTGPHWLGAAGLAWLASEVVEHFLHRD